MVVRGVVQGVGFRPFVFGLAERLGLGGFVCNTSGTVVIEVEGSPAALDALVEAVIHQAPPLARVASVEESAVPLVGEATFRIAESQPVAGEYQPISPDAATCEDCLRELFDPSDRRYRYPFINCTNCGPRFTIIEDVPYDRPLTTMRHFTMCARCRAEYEDPRDRRFHAQPNACPECGPQLWFADAQGRRIAGDPIDLAAAALRRGEIVAVKGLGGFQLACDATDEAVVARLRQRKRRPAKPFAVMVADVETAEAIASLDAAERAELGSPARPIVLVTQRPDGEVHLAREVAPGLTEVGLMLPATPLHHLLLRAVARPLVMTSGNVSEEPIAKDNDEAVGRLSGIADAFLLHDRDIYARYDDSVVRVVAGRRRAVRRARGLCPVPLVIQRETPTVLALGGQLKNTFCILRDRQAFVGPHIGDLEHPLSLLHQEEALTTYLRLFRAAPEVVACDLHPDYATTRLAETWWERGAAAEQVQHHHAHVASVMAEHALAGPVLGVAFDGLGYGPDGTIWGGEFLVCDERDFTRVGHIVAVRQPGGDLCAREGWRMAAAYLAAMGAEPEPLPWMTEVAGLPDERRWRLVTRAATSPGLAPLSTSAGRLFDAVASLLGIAHLSTYEAEAAMRLEAVATPLAGAVDPIEVDVVGSPLRLDSVGLVAAVLDGRRRGMSAAECAALFHRSLARAVARGCRELAARTGIRRVALGGGVFQNALLLRTTLEELDAAGLEAYANCDVPANDGGISLGQALVAGARRATAGHSG